MSQSHPLSGHWQPNPHLQHLYYGPDCVSKHLLSSLPNPSSKAIIITGTTLATRTPLVQRLQTLLSTHHAATISSITQHTPSHTIDAALNTLLTLYAQDPTIDTLISLGGGSPIDAAKILALKFHQTTTSKLTLTHLAIPTTLSAAETTPGGSTTQPNGTKTAIRDAKMAVHGIFYDPVYTKYTPMGLWLSTGIRALDHAVEAMYHPTASEVPWKILAIHAVRELFECLPKAKDNHMRDDAVTVRLMLASFASSGLKGEDLGGAGGMGLSHSLGYALGSPYGIPHGVTSCVTLGKVVGFMAGEKGKEREIARLVEAVGGVRTGDDAVDARVVGEKIVALVEALGLGVGSLEEEFGVCRDEVPVIVKRALRGVDRGEFYDRVEGLVKSFF